MANPNVLHRAPRPTKTGYLEAVQEIIGNISIGLTDQDLADRLGCTRETISNVRNMKGSLSPVTLAQIGHEFGPEALQPFAELFGAVIVPLEADDSDLDEITEKAAGVVASILHWRRDRLNHTHERPLRLMLKALGAKIHGYLERRSERRIARRAA